MNLIQHHHEIQDRMRSREKRDDLIRQYFAMGMKNYQIVARVGCSNAHVSRVINAEKARLQSGDLTDTKQQFAYTLNQLDLLWRETWESYIRSCNDELITEDFEVLESMGDVEELNRVLGHNAGTKTLKKIARTREGGINHLRTLLEILRFKSKILGLETVDLSGDNLEDMIGNFDLYAADIVQMGMGESENQDHDPDAELYSQSGLNELQAMIGSL